MKLVLTVGNKIISLDAAASPERMKERQLKSQANFERTMRRGQLKAGTVYNNCAFDVPFPIGIQTQGQQINGNQEEAYNYTIEQTGAAKEFVERILDTYRRYWKDRNPGAKEGG